MPIATQLERFAHVLSDYRIYWQFSPFAWVAGSAANTPSLNQLEALAAWPRTLCDALAQLSDAEVAQLEASPAQLQVFFRPWFYALSELPPIATSGHTPIDEPPFWLTNGIGGRKLAQIQAFLGQVSESAGSAVEWCAGKGHLGRIFAYNQQRVVTSVEWQASLCEQGQAIAQQQQLPQQFVNADVLRHTEQTRKTLADANQAFALHACGDLHLALIEQAANAGCSALYIAPCCYHLTERVPYNGVSSAARKLFLNQQLQLSAHDLKLAVQGQVTAGERIAQLRRTEVHWRLAFQCLREGVTGDARYHPLRSINKSWFSGDFAAFAQWAAAQHDVRLPRQCDWQQFLAMGAQRARMVARLELVRHAFRRQLESLLVLDRAMWLTELGYDVSLVEFCAYEQSPRNFLLNAQKN